MSCCPDSSAGPQALARGIERLGDAIDSADAVVVGAGSGLSTAAGLSYDGPRFRRHFAAFERAYGFRDMYSGCFYPYPDEESSWAFWSRHVMCNRYDQAPGQPYLDLKALLGGSDFFVLTTNVDHQFQIAGFPKERLFYTQGDYGLFQCAEPCCQETFGNEEAIRSMAERQRDLRIPSELIPSCPRCGGPVTMNLRVDAAFVEDEGWHRAQERYCDFLRQHAGERVLFLELGVGFNSPGVIKYPFWQMALANENARYACVNWGEAWAPKELRNRSIVLNADLANVLHKLAEGAAQA